MVGFESSPLTIVQPSTTRTSKSRVTLYTINSHTRITLNLTEHYELFLLSLDWVGRSKWACLPSNDFQIHNKCQTYNPYTVTVDYTKKQITSSVNFLTFEGFFKIQNKDHTGKNFTTFFYAPDQQIAKLLINFRSSN